MLKARIRFFWSAVLIICICPPMIWASDISYLGIRRDFETTRALGMGNAFTAVSDDSTAIFYNPAGLGQLKNSDSEFFIRADGSNDATGFIRDLTQSTDLGIQEITQVLEDNYGRHYSGRASVGFLWANSVWGLAFIPADLSVDGSLNQSAGPALDLLGLNDSTLAFTYNWLLERGSWGDFRLGLTSKLIYRWVIEKRWLATDIALNKGKNILDDLGQGLTLDGDLGLLWTGPFKGWNPSLALVVRNILSYGSITSRSNFKKLDRVVDLGASVFSPQWEGFRARLALDFRDFFHPNWNWIKGFHWGTEILWNSGSWFSAGLRGGFNQGYWTAGLTSQFGFFRLDLASYGEEIGIMEQNQINRRIILTLALDF